ncbi:hypothetical protein QJQ45_018951 [Haematococcus lacustris]|nr:hypothetical protein QJQ45_018951 [Haematococcus lacustris]
MRAAQYPVLDLARSFFLERSGFIILCSMPGFLGPSPNSEVGLFMPSLLCLVVDVVLSEPVAAPWDEDIDEYDTLDDTGYLRQDVAGQAHFEEHELELQAEPGVTEHFFTHRDTASSTPRRCSSSASDGDIGSVDFAPHSRSQPRAASAAGDVGGSSHVKDETWDLGPTDIRLAEPVTTPSKAGGRVSDEHKPVLSRVESLSSSFKDFDIERTGEADTRCPSRASDAGNRPGDEVDFQMQLNTSAQCLEGFCQPDLAPKQPGAAYTGGGLTTMGGFSLLPHASSGSPPASSPPKSSPPKNSETRLPGLALGMQLSASGSLSAQSRDQETQEATQCSFKLLFLGLAHVSRCEDQREAGGFSFPITSPKVEPQPDPRLFKSWPSVRSSCTSEVIGPSDEENNAADYADDEYSQSASKAASRSPSQNLSDSGYKLPALPFPPDARDASLLTPLPPTTWSFANALSAGKGLKLASVPREPSLNREQGVAGSCPQNPVSQLSPTAGSHSISEPDDAHAMVQGAELAELCSTGQQQVGTHPLQSSQPSMSGSEPSTDAPHQPAQAAASSQAGLHGSFLDLCSASLSPGDAAALIEECSSSSRHGTQISMALEPLRPIMLDGGLPAPLPLSPSVVEPPAVQFTAADSSSLQLLDTEAPEDSCTTPGRRIKADLEVHQINISSDSTPVSPTAPHAVRQDTDGQPEVCSLGKPSRLLPAAAAADHAASLHVQHAEQAPQAEEVGHLEGQTDSSAESEYTETELHTGDEEPDDIHQWQERHNGQPPVIPVIPDTGWQPAVAFPDAGSPASSSPSPGAASPLPRFTVDDAGVLTYEYDEEYINSKYEIFDLRVYHRRHRTGFEESKDFPIRMNDLIAGRYQARAFGAISLHAVSHALVPFVVDFLGSAAFSRAVQALDTKTGMLVCLKIIKNNKDYLDQSLDEIKLLKYVNDHDPNDTAGVVRLYDFFYYKEHLFLVCELLRANLYEFQKYNRESGEAPYFSNARIQRIARQVGYSAVVLPVPTIASHTSHTPHTLPLIMTLTSTYPSGLPVHADMQVLVALAYVHSLGLIHSDLKPENILIKSYSRCEVKVIDLGSSCFVTDQLSSYVQSRSYRAPEVILGLPYDHKVDVWSLGCILAELSSGLVLFQNDSLASLLARLEGILGPVPEWMLRKGRYASRFYTRRGQLYERNAATERYEILLPKRTSLRHRAPDADEGLLSFMAYLLHIDPNKRPTASEALQHPWLQHPYPILD